MAGLFRAAAGVATAALTPGALTDPTVGGSGCRREPPSLELAPRDEPFGGGTEPPAAPPARPPRPTPATALITPVVELPLLAAALVPPSAALPPAVAVTAPAPMEATARPVPTTASPVPQRSPPASAGAPPTMAANSFGICQQHIMKINAAPITSKATMLGCGPVPTF